MRRPSLIALILVCLSIVIWACGTDSVPGTDNGGDIDSGGDGNVLHDAAGPPADAATGNGDSATAPTTFTVGGTVAGLAGKGLTLKNGTESLAVDAAGAFTFKTHVAKGATYAVTVATQPASPTQTCTVAAGSGTATANVTSVAVTCTTDAFTVGGTITGLTGTGLVLQNGNGDDLAVSANGVFTFATPVPSGNAFSVTVKTQPQSPAQTCTVTGGTGVVGSGNVSSVAINCQTGVFLVGGQISGLAGTVVLQNNGGDNVTVSANGTFAFATPIASGATYAVTVLTQPASPSQTCTVTSGTGSVTNAAVTSVRVACVTNKYTVGGSVTGLVGTGLVLQNSGGDNLSLSADGTFVFATPITSGAVYTVSVLSQPTSPTQTCTITNGSGNVGGANVTNVAVTCGTNAYTVGGTISGLAGSGLVLQNSAGDDLAVSANGTFTFATPVASNATYAVTVLTQPSAPTQNCVVSGGTGTVASGNITSVTVNCAINTYAVGGTISGLSGTAVIQNNGGDDLPLTGNGTFSFATPIASGGAYAVTVLTQPSAPAQTCTVANGSGTVGSANITDVSITCTTNMYVVGGTVSGLVGSGLVLRDNGGDDLSITTDGPFKFATPVASGAPYAVTVQAQPTAPSQTCVVTSGSGSVGGADVTNVTVTCTVNTYAVGGTVTGLAGSGLILQDNGGDNLSISSNGTFAFATPVASGQAYAATVFQQPSSPSQTCVVTTGSGTAGSADVTTINVACTTIQYTIGGTVTGLAGSGLVLRDNGGDDKTVSANGSFTFATSVASGAPYAVTIFAQPSSPTQTCTVSAGSGTVGAANVTTVQITCSTSSFTVGGTITGLNGTVVLQNNGGSNLSVSSGSFAFPAALSGTGYNVTVLTNPASPAQTCTVTSGGTGTIGSANVTNVAITCTTNTYTVGGTVSGLGGGGPVVLQNNLGNNLSVAANGSFTFTTPIPSGQTYSVTVLSPPSNATCTVTSGTGTIGSANVTNVVVSCVTPAGTTCSAIKAANPAATDGVYLISPGGVPAFSVYCDMTTDGGGWAKILMYNNSAYTPTTAAAGTIAIAGTGAFAKLSDAQINAMGGSGASKTYRYKGNQTANNLYVRTSALYIDTARAMNLTGSIFACQATTIAGCSFTSIAATTTDSLAWGLVGNDSNRFFCDYGNTPQCYNPSDNTVRCFNAGVSTGHVRIDSFSLWVRESAVPTGNLVGYWSFEQAAGTVTDLSGNGNNAAAVVGTQVAGKVGLAYSFSGANQCIGIPNSASLASGGNTALSMMAWETYSVSGGEFINKENTWEMAVQGNVLQEALPYPQGWAWFGNAALATNTWQHVAVTYDGATVTHYRNGVSVFTRAQTGAFTSNTLGLGIGCRNVATNGTLGGASQFLTGSIDEAFVYSRALSAAEIAAYYNATK